MDKETENEKYSIPIYENGVKTEWIGYSNPLVIEIDAGMFAGSKPIDGIALKALELALRDSARVPKRKLKK